MIQDEKIVFNSILKNPILIEKLKGVDKYFFTSKRNNDILRLIKSGKDTVLKINESFPKKEQAEINEYLIKCFIDVYEIPVSQLQDAVNDILKEKVNLKMIKLINEGAKTGIYDHKKLRVLYTEIDALDNKNKVELKPLSRRETKPIEWLWENRFPLGTVSLIGGGKSTGKSTVINWIAAQIIKGADWPDSKKGMKGNVILAQTENDWERQVKPFFETAGANTDNLFEFDSESNKTEVIVSELEQHVIKIGNVKLIIFDPITEFVGSLEGNAEIQVRHVLKPFFSLANKYNLSIIMVKHTRKAPSDNILDKVGGSGSWVNVPRAVWLVANDEEDPKGERRKFLFGALNICKRQPSLAFKIIENVDNIKIPEVVWESEPLTEDPNQQFMDPE